MAEYERPSRKYTHERGPNPSMQIRGAEGPWGPEAHPNEYFHPEVPQEEPPRRSGGAPRGHGMRGYPDHNMEGPGFRGHRGRGGPHHGMAGESRLAGVKRGGRGRGGIPPKRQRVLQEGINREKVCPFLLKAYPKVGGHRDSQQYNTANGPEPSDMQGELQLYTWQDASLKEIFELVQDGNNDARRRGARVSFALVYPDKKGKYVMRRIGSQLEEGVNNMEDQLQLREVDFQIGDLLDVAIHI